MDDLWAEVEAEKELVENTLAELTKALKDYLGFRHFFVHAYGILLDAEKPLPLANNATEVWHSFYAEIVAAYRTLKQ